MSRLLLILCCALSWHALATHAKSSKPIIEDAGHVKFESINENKVIADDFPPPPDHLVEGSRGKGEWFAEVINELRKPHHGASSFATERPPKDSIRKAEYEAAKRANMSDAKLDFTGLANKYGYPVEKYTVRTEDGYHLRLFRIPYGINGPTRVNGTQRPVVFLMHGLMDSADSWIIMGPQKGLAYLLADAGYDVWLGNARGNTYSKKHDKKRPTEYSFWDFSWDEIGQYDLPAMIDFVLDTTQQKKLFYVGHSQGTTSFFVMCSMLPKYSEKVHMMFALAPIAWMSHLKSPFIRLLSPGSKGIEWVTAALGVGEFFPRNELLSIAGGKFCSAGALTEDLCMNSIFIVCGYNADQFNATMLPVILGHTPSGSSVKQFLHYGQGVQSAKFRRYDHGLGGNLFTYGSLTPPKYDVANVKCPVALYYSDNDWLSHPKDVEILRKNLGNVVEAYRVPMNFNHMDYLWGIDADVLVYDRIIRSLKQHKTKP